MELEEVVLGEISEKERQTINDLLHMYSKTSKTRERAISNDNELLNFDYRAEVTK